MDRKRKIVIGVVALIVLVALGYWWLTKTDIQIVTKKELSAVDVKVGQALRSVDNVTSSVRVIGEGLERQKQNWVEHAETHSTAKNLVDKLTRSVDKFTTDIAQLQDWKRDVSPQIDKIRKLEPLIPCVSYVQQMKRRQDCVDRELDKKVQAAIKKQYAGSPEMHIQAILRDSASRQAEKDLLEQQEKVNLQAAVVAGQKLPELDQKMDQAMAEMRRQNEEMKRSLSILNQGLAVKAEATSVGATIQRVGEMERQLRTLQNPPQPPKRPFWQK